jgi:hypothetical protein
LNDTAGSTYAPVVQVNSPPFIVLRWLFLFPVHVRAPWYMGLNLCRNLRLSWTSCRCAQSQRGKLAAGSLCPPKRGRRPLKLLVCARHRIRLLLALSLLGLGGLSFAQNSQRSLPARPIPTPTTVSKELQKAISPSCEMPVSAPPRSNEEWEGFRAKVGG